MIYIVTRDVLWANQCRGDLMISDTANRGTQTLRDMGTTRIQRGCWGSTLLTDMGTICTECVTERLCICIQRECISSRILRDTGTTHTSVFEQQVHSLLILVSRPYYVFYHLTYSSLCFLPSYIFHLSPPPPPHTCTSYTRSLTIPHTWL